MFRGLYELHMGWGLAVDERLYAYGAPIPCGARRDLVWHASYKPANVVSRKIDSLQVLSLIIRNSNHGQSQSHSHNQRTLFRTGCNSNHGQSCNQRTLFLRGWQFELSLSSYHIRHSIHRKETVASYEYCTTNLP